MGVHRVKRPRMGARWTYSLEGRDYGKFIIDPANGNVRTKAGVVYDYERQRGCRYRHESYSKCFEMTLVATGPGRSSEAPKMSS